MAETINFDSIVQRETARIRAENRRATAAATHVARTAFAASALERSEEAALRQALLAKEQRLRSRHEARGRRNLAREGTRPEEVWGPEAGRLGDTFIEYVAERDFAGSTRLRQGSWKTVRTGWSIRGYGVGAVAFGLYNFTDEKDPMATKRQSRMFVRCTDRPYNVYFCEDSKLHFFSNGQDPYEPTPANVYKRPVVISDLPLNDEGRIVVPVVGHFETMEDDGDLRGLHAATPSTAATGSREPVLYDPYDTWRGPYFRQDYFVPDNLDRLLGEYAAYADMAVAETA